MLSLPRLTPETLQFVLLSFEGPDEYSMAGGLGVRMKELALELSRKGFRTHLLFVGDPDLPGREDAQQNLTLYRWCQWLSAHHRGGVYEAEESKLTEWNATLPRFVVDELVRPAAERGVLTAVLAEEWHTAYSTCLLSDQLWSADLRDRAVILWNANNVMGFDRIDWARLGYCSQITTVSRYMKHVMWGRGVNPIVVPNGIPLERVVRPPAEAHTALAEGHRPARAPVQDRTLEPRQTLEHGRRRPRHGTPTGTGHDPGDPRRCRTACSRGAAQCPRTRALRRRPSPAPRHRRGPRRLRRSP